MTTTERVDAPLRGGEADTLLGFLDYHRDTLRMKTEGLGAAQLDQRLEPSSITLGGLLKHLAYVEDWWFGRTTLHVESGPGLRGHVYMPYEWSVVRVPSPVPARTV